MSMRFKKEKITPKEKIRIRIVKKRTAIISGIRIDIDRSVRIEIVAGPDAGSLGGMTARDTDDSQ